MHILNLIQCTNLGGMEVSSLRLMQCLMRRGHTVEVLALHPIGGLGTLLCEAGIVAEGLAYRGRGGWRSLFAVRSAIARHRYDALLMTGHNLMGMLALGGDRAHRRVLAMHYHHLGVKPRWQWQLIYRVALSKFDAITFPSDFVRAEAQAIHPGVAKVARTVRNPIMLPQRRVGDKTAARSRLGLPEGATVIGNAGHLIARKRFDLFLEVAAQLARRKDGCCFVIAGDGELRGALHAQALRLGIADRVVWTGWVADMSDFYCALDVLLFNSDWDAYPTTPIEAMSYGVAVVASSLYGGLNEAIVEPAHGILLDRHDIYALADAVIACLRDDADRPGRGARERIAEMTLEAHTVGEIEHLLVGGT